MRNMGRQYRVAKAEAINSQHSRLQVGHEIRKSNHITLCLVFSTEPVLLHFAIVRFSFGQRVNKPSPGRRAKCRIIWINSDIVDRTLKPCGRFTNHADERSVGVLTLQGVSSTQEMPLHEESPPFSMNSVPSIDKRFPGDAVE